MLNMRVRHRRLGCKAFGHGLVARLSKAAWNLSRSFSSALSIIHGVCRYFLRESAPKALNFRCRQAPNIVAIATVAIANARTALPSPRCADRDAPNGKCAAHESGSRARQARPLDFDLSERPKRSSISRGGCNNNRDASAGHSIAIGQNTSSFFLDSSHPSCVFDS